MQGTAVRRNITKLNYGSISAWDQPKPALPSAASSSFSQLCKLILHSPLCSAPPPPPPFVLSSGMRGQSCCLWQQCWHRACQTAALSSANTEHKNTWKKSIRMGSFFLIFILSFKMANSVTYPGARNATNANRVIIAP